MAASQYYFANSRLVLGLIGRSDGSERLWRTISAAYQQNPLVKNLIHGRKGTEVEASSHHPQAALGVPPADPALTPWVSDIRTLLFRRLQNFKDFQVTNFAIYS